MLHINSLEDRHAFRGCEAESDAADQHEELTVHNEGFLCCVCHKGSECAHPSTGPPLMQPYSAVI